ncbi:ferroxidase fet3 [Coemansia sp. RSA 2336]|nr:ferroxidase fet3 [Coemansia sp. RSA 2336]
MNLLTCITLLAGAYARRIELNWDVGYVQVNRDGYKTRTAIGVNGKLPIPPVYADEGDMLALTVHNSLNHSTSIHAHGILQTGSNYMDGAAMVTQCGIPPGDTFTYEIYLNQTGTYWLHGHDHDELADGLRTPLIIRDKQSPYDYDGEYVLGLEDWYDASFQERMDLTTDPTKPFPPPPSYPYALINGANANFTKPMVFVPGSTYRVRLVNMAATEWFKFSMPGHEMFVIEADGVYSDPFAIAAMTIGPGQRYSVLVKAHDTNTLNYQYLVELYASFVPHIDGMNPRYYSGTIRYSENAVEIAADKQEALSQIPEDVSLAWDWDIQLQSRAHNPLLPATRSFDIVIGGAHFSDGVTRDLINNSSYAPPMVPSLYTAKSTGQWALNPTTYGPNSNAIVLDYEESVEFVIHNPSRLPHAMHQHGYTFQIVEYGPIDDSVATSQGVIPPDTPAPLRRFDRWPMERDTVVVLPMQYVKIRFRANNIGTWLHHCHILAHQRLGMAMTVVVAPDLVQQLLPIPDSMYKLCRKQKIKTQGNAAGNPGLDLTGLPEMPYIMSF